MNDLATLLLALVDRLPVGIADDVTSEGIGITDMVLDLPTEFRIEDNAEVVASLPRGRLVTGFDPYIGRLKVNLVRGLA